MWSRKRGRKEVKQVLGQAHGALHKQPLIVADTVRFVRFAFGTTFKDADGVRTTACNATGSWWTMFR